MRKILAVLFGALLICGSGILLTACGGNDTSKDSNHTHEYNYVYYNYKEHWSECKCGAKQEKQAHVYTEGICETCEKIECEGLAFDYNRQNDSYTVVGIGSCGLSNISIPRKYNGKPVTSIGDRALFNCTSLTSIEIPDSVTSIGEQALACCYYSLTSVEIGDGVTSIGEGAFGHCYSLTSIVIPDNVTSIGSYAFSNCDSLETIVIGDSVTSIGDYAFEECTSLTSVLIPDSVTSIGFYAFDDCTSLTIYCEAESKPSGWDSDWNSNCPVVWDYKNNDVADDGYIYTIVDGLRYALKDGEATVACKVCNIATAIILSQVEYKGNTYSVTSIGDYAFENCDSLEAIEIPGGVTSIGHYAFYSCTSLTSIEIPDSVTSMGSSAFYECTSLTSIVIGDSVTSIGEYAFYNCRSLTSVEIPGGVTSIGYKAFSYCYSLTIYCKAESKPSGWDSDWNYSNRPVVWGYKGQE